MMERVSVPENDRHPPVQPQSDRAVVVLIRHAEKTGRLGDRGLSETGWRRAKALASALPLQVGTIDALIAAKSTGKSARPVQTVEPLAEALGLSVDQSWNTEDYAALAAALREKAEYQGRQVLACWRHDTLPQLARALGAADAGPWPESLYDRIWVLRLLKDGARLSEMRQDVDLSSASGETLGAPRR